MKWLLIYFASPMKAVLKHFHVFNVNEKMNWKENNNSLNKDFEFKNFIEAWAFLCKVAMVSEKINHHPDIRCNYNKISLSLSTHSEGGITEKDKELAGKIDEL